MWTNFLILFVSICYCSILAIFGSAHYFPDQPRSIFSTLAVEALIHSRTCVRINGSKSCWMHPTPARYQPPLSRPSRVGNSIVVLHDNNNSKWERNVEEQTTRQLDSDKSGIGETLAGAVLGGLLLGPFGM
jgi:hypothetical protein